MFPVAVSTVSTPPTPFADRESLEAELLAIEREIGTIKLARLQQDPEQTSLSSLTMPDLVETEAGPSLAALRHLKADDIDSFIANMAVPPPPTKQVYKQHFPVVELTTEDISAFIIPPPPGGEGNNGYRTGNPDREVQEVKVDREVVEMARGSRDKVSPKIASLQERIQLLKGEEGQGKGNFAPARSPEGVMKGKELGLNLTKDKFGYPLPEGKVRSPPDAPDSNIVKGGVQNKREIFMRHLGSPDTYKPFVKVTETMDAPPPPPPRSSVPKPGLNQFNSSTLGRGKPRPNPTLLKSTSQDDIMLKPAAGVHKVRTMASKFNSKVVSTSIEDLDTKRSPLSPSKMSLTSSSDSLSSNTSVNTVKSVSPAEENPPSLPPRPSPTKPRQNSITSPDEITSKLVSNSPFRTGEISPTKPPIHGLPSPLSPSVVSPFVPSSPKPVLPSRTSKPASPVKSPPSKHISGRSLPQVPASSPGRARQAAPTPPASPRPARQPVISKPNQPSPQPSPGRLNIPPQPPQPPPPRYSHPPPQPTTPAPSRLSQPPPPPPPLNKLSSPLLTRRSGDLTVPVIPNKAMTTPERLTGGRKLPVPPPNSSNPATTVFTNGTSSPVSPRYTKTPDTNHVAVSPKAILKRNGQVNGHVNGHHPVMNGHSHSEVYTNSEFDPNDSLEGTSVDDPESENEAVIKDERSEVFKSAGVVVTRVLHHLHTSKAICLKADKENVDEDKFARSRELLTTEARQFVTASKLFVKSATESESQLIECLNHCVHMLDRIGKLKLFTTTLEGNYRIFTLQTNLASLRSSYFAGQIGQGNPR